MKTTARFRGKGHETATGPGGAEAAAIIAAFARGRPATFRGWQQFVQAARQLFDLPAAPGVEHLLPEAAWRSLVPPEHEETVLPALSQATGIYFFPSREWLSRFCRLLVRLRCRRVLEAGAGRGYLAAALAARLPALGIDFLAVEKQPGVYDQGLPRHPVVRIGDAGEAIRDWQPDLVLAAWPSPGQSIAPWCRYPWVRYLVVIGERGGGCTGDPGDWHRLPQRELSTLSRLGLGRSGRWPQAATLFFGAGHPAWGAFFKDKGVFADSLASLDS